jgi:cytochrome P450
MTSKVLKKIPKVPFIFLLQRIFNLKKKLLSEIEFLHKRYGDVFGIQVDNLKCFIKRPDLIKYVLVDNHLNYEKGVGFRLFHNIIGFGLLTSDGQKWMKERKTLNFEFSRQNQDLNYSIIEDELHKLESKWFNKEKANLSFDINELTVRTICRILFNYEFNDDIKELRMWFRDYDHFIGRQQKSFIKVPIWVPLPYLRKANASIVGLRNFAKKLMIESIDSDSPNMIKRMAENGFDSETICDHILTFFIAGHETTANSLFFTFMLLRDHPEYFNKLKSEVNSIEEVTRESIDSLETLDCIIKESLRLYPTIPLFPRIAKKDDKLGEFAVKKGDMIAFSPYIIHRSEKYWERPLDFYPERFIGKKFEKDFIYFPFGLGPRKCIGATLSTLQMKKIIHFIFKNFDFSIKGPKIDNFLHNVSLSPAEDVYLDFLKTESKDLFTGK